MTTKRLALVGFTTTNNSGKNPSDWFLSMSPSLTEALCGHYTRQKNSFAERKFFATMSSPWCEMLEDENVSIANFISSPTITLKILSSALREIDDKDVIGKLKHLLPEKFTQGNNPIMLFWHNGRWEISIDEKEIFENYDIHQTVSIPEAGVYFGWISDMLKHRLLLNEGPDIKKAVPTVTMGLVLSALADVRWKNLSKEKILDFLNPSF